MSFPWRVACLVLVVPLFSVVAGDKSGRVKVTVEAGKEERTEAEAPVDPAPHLQYKTFVGATFAVNINDESGRRLHLGHFPTIKIDGNVTVPGGGGMFTKTGGALPKKGTK